MPRYTVKASVSVDVEMSIEAASADLAKAIFDDRIIMTASLDDTPTERYAVHEDSISDVQHQRVEAE